MTCERFELPDGTKGIICHRGRAGQFPPTKTVPETFPADKSHPHTKPKGPTMINYDLQLEKAEHFLALARLDLKENQTTLVQMNLVEADKRIDEVLADIELKDFHDTLEALQTKTLTPNKKS